MYIDLYCLDVSMLVHMDSYWSCEWAPVNGPVNVLVLINKNNRYDVTALSNRLAPEQQQCPIFEQPPCCLFELAQHDPNKAYILVQMDF